MEMLHIILLIVAVSSCISSRNDNVISSRHCDTSQLEYKCRIIQGRGYWIIFSGACDVPDTTNSECWQKYQMDGKQCDPCCNSEQTSLPNCQHLISGRERPTEFPEDIQYITGNHSQSAGRNSIYREAGHHWCYENGYHYIGSPLKVWNHAGTKVNYKNNVISLQECREECKTKQDCLWFNWIDSTGNSRDRNTCWLKRGKGQKGRLQGGFTGHRESTKECPSGQEADYILNSNPDDDNAHNSTQNGDKTLYVEDIMKIYEDKENSGEGEEETTNVGEQNIFPEHEMMIKMVESTKTSKEDLNDGGSSSGEKSMKAELDNLKAEIKKKDETLMEKEERILEKDIEITTLKDEIESINKTAETKSEEMDVMIASVNSLEEEKSIMKVKLMKESKTVEKQNIMMKKIFKEKECLQKENLSLTKATKEGDDDEKSDSMLKKKN